MLSDASETKRYQYLADSGFWYDSTLKVHQDFNFNFNYPEDLYKITIDNLL